MFRQFTIAIAAVILAVTARFADAGVLYSTTFDDLAGWSTFVGFPAAASTDVETDGRTVYVNGNPTGGVQSIIQRTLPDVAELGPYSSLSAVLRRNAPAATYITLKLFRDGGDTHTAGDIQDFTVFLNASNGAQINISRYDTTLGSSVTTSSYFSTAALPFNDLASDYTTLTLSLPQDGQFTLTDSALVLPIFSLSVGSQFAQFTKLRSDIYSSGESESAWLVDSLTLTVPEPASFACMAGIGGSLLAIRRRRLV